MSRGLGSLQRQILHVIDATNKPPREHRSAAGLSNLKWDSPETGRRQVFVHGWRLVLADGAYDLRAVSQVLAKRHGKIRYYADGKTEIDPSFRSAFAHAVKGLVERGELIRLAKVPFEHAEPGYPYTWGSAEIPNIARWEPSEGTDDSDDLPGFFDVSNAKQTRFVARGVSVNSPELVPSEDGTHKRQPEQVDAYEGRSPAMTGRPDLPPFNSERDEIR